MEELWEDMRYVLAVARTGTATAAGKVLRVNATTVTRRITALEASLGTLLFDRTTRGMTATDAGAYAVEAAEAMEEAMLRMDAGIRGLEHELVGPLRITSMEAFFELWREDLRAFRKAHPQVELRLSSSYAPTDLGRREADVAIRLTPSPPERLVGRRLTEVFFAIYGNDEMASASDPPWIGWDEPFQQGTDDVKARLAPQARMICRITSMAHLTRCLEDGEGVSLLPCFIGDRHPCLKRIGTYFEGGTYLWALTEPQLRRASRVQAFMSAVASWVGRDGPLIRGETSLCRGRDPGDDASAIS